MCLCPLHLDVGRIPMGHAKKTTSRAWTDYGEDDEEDRYPTIAYTMMGVYTGTSKYLYKIFTNELDALTAFQVNWRTYDEREWGFDLYVMCRLVRLLWRCIAPMICVYAIVYHLLHCVAQFGKARCTPPGRRIDTGGSDLHSMSRKKNESIIDWGDTHATYMKEWDKWKTRKDVERKVIDWDVYEDHLRWYYDGIKHCLRLRPKWTTENAEALYDDGYKAYHESIRDTRRI